LLVMRAGQCVEQGGVEQIFHKPRSAYTQDLLAAVPRLDDDRVRTPLVAAPALLEVSDLAVHYRVPAAGAAFGQQTLRALDGVALRLAPGETLGVVGESGCGKSTLARAILRLVAPTHGRVCLLGAELAGLPEADVRPHRRDMQLVFQDPLAALDPRMTVRNIVAEPLEAFEAALGAAEVTARVGEALKQVGLDPAWMNRYPHQFSGGQCQRIGIARALVLKPQLLVCDEAVSALDVTVQAQIIALLLELQAQLGLAMIFIAHDLAVVRRISHRIMVMYLGRVMEVADAAPLCAAPLHPYSRALIAAVPLPDPRLERQRKRVLTTGEVPSLFAPPSGCPFRTRCSYAIERCVSEVPVLRTVGNSSVACHRAGEI
jgi:oligopeptide transport system ATP-binding protein